MPELFFYRLEGRALADVLPQLLEKTRERGWRAVVQLGTPAAIPELSQKIWAYKPESFLAHGFEGEGTNQPIWLTATAENPNAASVRFFVSGAVPGDITGLERAIYVFEAEDEPAVEQARARWRLAKTESTPARFFIFSEGRWKEQQG
jgi:DNA polymerase-3 subunit chi